MSRAQVLAILGGVLALLVLAYFVLMAARPEPFGRILLARGYEEKGWTEQRLTARVRLLGVVGVVLALAAILLAIVKFVG
jgi:hypothetical protein